MYYNKTKSKPNILQTKVQSIEKFILRYLSSVYINSYTIAHLQRILKFTFQYPNYLRSNFVAHFLTNT